MNVGVCIAKYLENLKILHPEIKILKKRRKGEGEVDEDNE